MKIIVDVSPVFGKLLSLPAVGHPKPPNNDPQTMQRQITYRRRAITRLFPSGYYEIYSDRQSRFLKFDTLAAAKQAIRDDLPAAKSAR